MIPEKTLFRIVMILFIASFAFNFTLGLFLSWEASYFVIYLGVILVLIASICYFVLTKRPRKYFGEVMAFFILTIVLGIVSFIMINIGRAWHAGN